MHINPGVMHRDMKKLGHRKSDRKLVPWFKLDTVELKIYISGVKLAMMMTGHNVTDFDEKSLRMISPRMMSLVPNDVKSSSNEVSACWLRSECGAGHYVAKWGGAFLWLVHSKEAPITFVWSASFSLMMTHSQWALCFFGRDCPTPCCSHY